MALRKIVFAGDEMLRKRCREVAVVDDRIRMILDDMGETMKDSNGIGLAAPQIGILRRMIVVEAEDGAVIELINPRIVESTGSRKGDEGCLSIPCLVGVVERPENIKVEALDRFGREFTCEGEGMVAVALSHEIDHLEGILYIDKAEDLWAFNPDDVDSTDEGRECVGE